MKTVKKTIRKNPGVRPLLHSDRGFNAPRMTTKHLK